MGITGLLPLLKSIHKQCNLRDFSGRTIGVDAYGWLHRGTVACAIDLALGKPSTKYVDFAMHRVRMLLHFGIKPYIVFDGDYLPSKARTEKERATRRAESKRVGLELLKLGKTTQAQVELQKAVDVTPDMAKQLIERLKSMNVDYLVAPYEADSQLAYLERKGLIQGIISEDSDLLVFGAKCLLTKLDQYGECVMISRNNFTACREVSLVGWSDAEFRHMAILSGCDYLAGINKMGLKTAHRLIRKHKTVERIIRAAQFESQFKIPAGYLDQFRQAELTFLHQWVFCPISNRLVHLNELPDDAKLDEMEYLGPCMDPEIAIGVARGDLHPHTKRKLAHSTPTNTSSKSIQSASWKKAGSISSDLKKNRTIESCFKPRRIPLAELDPNSFTPSPSQRDLLRDRPAAWSASAAPERVYLNTTAIPSSGSVPRVSRRATSGSWPERVGAGDSPKRQRLCSDSAVTSSVDAPAKIESGTSRFFAGKPDSDSPSWGKKAKKGQVPKATFNLWSDDSIDEALSLIPDPQDGALSRPKKSFLVARDDPQELPVADRSHTETTKDLSEPSAHLQVEGSPPQPSTAAPMGNLSLSNTTQKRGSSFGAQLSAEIDLLRRRFSYEPPKTSSIIFSDSSLTGKEQPRDSSSVTDQLPFLVDPKHADSQQHEPEMSNTDQASMVKDPSPAAQLSTIEVHASPPKPKSQPAHVSHSNGTQRASANSAAELRNRIPTPVSRQARASLPTPDLLRSIAVSGSEDLLVPDSEGEPDASGSEVEEMWARPKPLDLAKFAFVST